MHPSSTVPGFVLCATTVHIYAPHPRIWRSYNYGDTWERVFYREFPYYAWIYDSWSGQDALTDFSFSVFSDPETEFWYYYTLDGGDSFDSLLTGVGDGGYGFRAWGDSVMVMRTVGVDSLYISPDHGQTLEFRLGYPNGEAAPITDGKLSQLICDNFYHGPYSPVSPRNRGIMNPNDISMSIYPNPTNSSAFIQLSGVIITDPIQIRIYDILGRQTRSFQVRLQAGSNTNIPLPINDLASGTYFITIEDANMHQPLVQKVVVLK